MSEETNSISTTLGYLFVILIFVLSAPVCAFAAPIAWINGGEIYADHVVRSMSRMFAALLGRSGLYSTSAECGVAKQGFFYHLRRLVDFLLGDGHCKQQAKIERIK